MYIIYHIYNIHTVLSDGAISCQHILTIPVIIIPVLRDKGHKFGTRLKFRQQGQTCTSMYLSFSYEKYTSTVNLETSICIEGIFIYVRQNLQSPPWRFIPLTRDCVDTEIFFEKKVYCMRSWRFFFYDWDLLKSINLEYYVVHVMYYVVLVWVKIQMY